MKCSAAASAEEDEEEEEEEDEGGEGQTVEGLHARTTAQASEAPICGRLVSINYLDCAIRGPKGQAEKIVLSRSKLFRSDERAALLTLVPLPSSDRSIREQGFDSEDTPTRLTLGAKIPDWRRRMSNWNSLFCSIIPFSVSF